MGEGPDVSLLDDVLGLAVVAQNSAGEPVEPAIVRLHDRTNGLLIAPAGTTDQFGIAGRDMSNLWCLCAHNGFALSDETVLLMSWMRKRQIGSRTFGTF